MKIPKKVVIEEFLEFYSDKAAWYNGGAYIDDADDELYEKHVGYKGGDAIALIPGEMIDVRLFNGYLDWQGNGDAPADMPDTLVELFYRWWDKRTTVTLAFKVPKDKADAVNEAVKQALK